jgi:hypothetical protein
VGIKEQKGPAFPFQKKGRLAFADQALLNRQDSPGGRRDFSGLGENPVVPGVTTLIFPIPNFHDLSPTLRKLKAGFLFGTSHEEEERKKNTAGLYCQFLHRQLLVGRVFILALRMTESGSAR